MAFNKDWISLGDTSVRNILLYNNVELPLAGHCMLASSQYGGPIALVPSASTKPVIIICAQNGKPYVQIEDGLSESIFGIYWSKSQQLIVLETSGNVFLYSALGKLVSTFSMGEETQALGVVDARAFSNETTTGLAVLNKAGHLWAVNSVSTSVLWKVHDPGKQWDIATCWTMIPSPKKPTAAIFWLNSQFYTAIQESVVQPCPLGWALTEGQYTGIQPSEDYSMVAFVHSSFVVQTVTGDLGVELHRISLHAKAPTTRLLWCGGAAIAFQRSSTSIQVYSTNNKSYTYTFPAPIYCGTEPDGIRLFTRNNVYFLTPVTKELSAVLGVASSEPGALLFEASLKLEARHPQAYEYIQLIGDRMNEAIDQCLLAGAQQFDAAEQKSFARAASLGRAFNPARYDVSKFVDILRSMRLMNVARQMGIPISYAEVQELSVASFIDRLIELQHWPIALRACQLLEIPPEDGVYRVLVQWSVYLMDTLKISEVGNEDAVAQKIFARFKDYPDISYADVAKLAAKKELPGLATLLLDKEPNLTRQVNMLLELKQVDKALTRAAKSQQPDLLHMVLRHLRHSIGSKEVELLIRKIPEALSLYQSYMQEETPEQALALYQQNDDFTRQAIYHLQVARNVNDPFGSTTIAESLARAEKALHNLREMHTAQLVKESAQLVLDNAKRDETHGTSLMQQSLRETFIWAVGQEQTAIVEQLKKQHRLSDKQVWYWTIEGLAQTEKWAHLEQFGRTKKSPIGYVPFIAACVKYDNANMAARFMDKITAYEERVSAFMLLGDVNKAASVAAEKNDLARLQDIRRQQKPRSDYWNVVTSYIDRARGS